MKPDQEKQTHEKRMGIGCGTSVIAFIIMAVFSSNENVDGVAGLIFFISLIYGLFQHHKAKVISGNQFRSQLPMGYDRYITLRTHRDKNTYSIERHFGNMGNQSNPVKGDTCLCLSNSKKVKFWKDGKFNPNEYYVTSINFTPNIQQNVTETGKTHGRLGSALVGGMLFGGVGAAIGAARKRKVVLHQNIEENEYGTNAYIQLVTTDFKKLRQIKITNVKTSDYKTLVANFMLNDIELKKLEAKHGLLKSNNSPEDAADKLAKMKKLVDQHVISQSDFDKYKNKLL